MTETCSLLDLASLTPSPTVVTVAGFREAQRDLVQFHHPHFANHSSYASFRMKTSEKQTLEPRSAINLSSSKRLFFSTVAGVDP